MPALRNRPLVGRALPANCVWFGTNSLLPRMLGVVMLAEHIFAKVIGRVAPDGMDVIGVVLRVVKLDQECRPLDAIVVPLPRLQGAGPSKLHFIPACRLDLLNVILVH